MTSRWITGQPNFLDFDMLDATIASALKMLLNTQSNFRRRVSVEELRAQNSDRFSRGRQIAYSRATGAHQAAQGLSTLFAVVTTWYGDDSPHLSLPNSQPCFGGSEVCARVTGKAGENGQTTGNGGTLNLDRTVGSQMW